MPLEIATTTLPTLESSTFQINIETYYLYYEAVILAVIIFLILQFIKAMKEFIFN